MPLTEEQETQARKVLAALEGGSPDDMFKAQEVASAIKAIIEAGKADEFHLRADFVDDEQAMAAARYEAMCSEFDDQVGKTELHHSEMSRAAIGGKRMDILRQAVIGSSATAPPKKGFGNWLKRKAGIENE